MVAAKAAALEVLTEENDINPNPATVASAKKVIVSAIPHEWIVARMNEALRHRKNSAMHYDHSGGPKL